MQTRRVWLVAIALVAQACGSEGTVVSATDGESEAAAFDVPVPADGVDAASPELPDLALPDTGPDTGTFEVPAELGDVPADSGPAPGEAGFPCAKPGDCASGYCILTADGKQCTVNCEEECPFGWSCVAYAPALPDQVFICAPRFLSLCKPCTSNSQCAANDTDAGQACVAYGVQGSFCGEPCQQHSDCPDGYGCVAGTDVSGTGVKQCVASQDCQCAKAFVDEGATTTCFVQNEWGTCTGERSCISSGLSGCSAATPAKEECNGLDDDCDGTQDEDTTGGECFVTNEFGSCPGITVCVGGQPFCEGDEALPETCDGADNDCDGKKDEEFEDTDGDGTPDCLENDKDGDGIADGLDNCPMDFNPGQKDSDMDVIGDVCDPDDDNDGTPDDLDCLPFDKEAFPGGSEVCDGKDNDCNFSVDEGFPDGDGDGLKDCVDPDDDNDGTPDAQDCGPLDAMVHPGAAEECDGLDNDCDFAVDEGFPDADGDGKADCADADADGDGVLDVKDNCDAVANPGQQDQDGDGLGDACDPDADGDSIPDAVDNCTGLKNTAQTDTDGDGLGDACDDDLDGDGVLNPADNCPLVANASQKDTDLDGQGDACENDQDGDGFPDAQDCAPLDPAVNPGASEVCDGLDNDCDLAQDEGFKDTDGDGTKDCVDPDDDNDGSADDADCAPLNPLINEDASEICDGLDNDCDGKPDDGLGSISCGKGLCAHSVPACVAGKIQTCDPMQGAEEEKCDGLDNDCDGFKDEDLGWTTCGLGVCAHTVANCKNGAAVACDPLQGAAAETCDGLDNDCDAKVDEGLGQIECGLGICKHKVTVCVGGEVQECDPFQGAFAEACDGLDSDCDGLTDEGLGMVSCGKGACLHEQPYCENGKVTVCDPFLGVGEEVCDGTDNDCNGLADEKLGLITCGQGICEHSVVACVDAMPQDCDPMEGAGVEVCNGFDDDCDGSVDESLGLVTCGQGECLHTVSACQDGNPQQCNPLDGAKAELCDGLDNDCDGLVDPADSFGCKVYFLDSDADGYGTPTAHQCLCTAKPPYSAISDKDCNDSNNQVNPSVPENCKSAADENCDGKVNDGCIYTSCKEALQYNPTAASGAYTIDPDAGGPVAQFPVYCDMTTDGGGWTLVMKQASNMGYGSPLQSSTWSGWGTPNVTLNPGDTTLADGNMANLAFSTVTAEKIRLTASATWKDVASGAWTRTVNSTPYTALSNATANQAGAEGPDDTTPWAPASFTDYTWTSESAHGYGLCWRSGPWFNRTSYEYTYGGIKWGWLFNNECGPSTTDTAEGLGCCGNADWQRKSPWILYLWAR